MWPFDKKRKKRLRIKLISFVVIPSSFLIAGGGNRWYFSGHY
jgi:hypothetical protein